MSGKDSQPTILDQARERCAKIDPDARIVDASPIHGGYAITFSLPKRAGITDDEWSRRMKRVRDSLQEITGVKRVLLDVM